jgi:hypothetical protein
MQKKVLKLNLNVFWGLKIPFKVNDFFYLFFSKGDQPDILKMGHVIILTR